MVTGRLGQHQIGRGVAKIFGAGVIGGAAESPMYENIQGQYGVFTARF